MREVDLYPPVLEHFGRYANVHAEVPAGRSSIDLVFSTSRNRLLLAAELKRRAPWLALRQAVLAQRVANFSVVGLPETIAIRAYAAHADVFRCQGVGLLSITHDGVVQLIPPSRSERLVLHLRRGTVKGIEDHRRRSVMSLTQALDLIHGERHAAKLLPLRRSA